MGIVVVVAAAADVVVVVERMPAVQVDSLHLLAFAVLDSLIACACPIHLCLVTDAELLHCLVF